VILTWIDEYFRALPHNEREGIRQVLDVGCGVGITTEKLNSYAPAIGIDLSEANIAVATSRGNAQYVAGDFTEIGGGMGRFDLVCLFDVLEHIRHEDRDVFFSTLGKVMGGKALISVPKASTLEWYRKNNPRVLQIVDNPIYDDDLSMFNIVEKRTKGIYTYYVIERKI
jgi:2-polyprenyl-3-methyl-5-hydroxy-6-metoxy-1,4-benzoquinol methylase